MLGGSHNTSQNVERMPETKLNPSNARIAARLLRCEPRIALVREGCATLDSQNPNPTRAKPNPNPTNR